MAYLGLFFTALIASTLFPMGSEVLLISLVELGLNIYILWAVATLGNTLGSCINYALGYWASDYIQQKYHNTSSWLKAQSFYNRYGVWSLLLAWLPIIGDPITLIAGLAKSNIKVFVALVLIGKGARYAVVIIVTKMAFG